VKRQTGVIERQKGRLERKKHASAAPHTESRVWLETALDQELLVHARKAPLLHQPASEAAAHRERRE
jgi:hypothetical protein